MSDDDELNLNVSLRQALAVLATEFRQLVKEIDDIRANQNATQGMYHELRERLATTDMHIQRLLRLQEARDVERKRASDDSSARWRSWYDWAAKLLLAGLLSAIAYAAAQYVRNNGGH